MQLLRGSQLPLALANVGVQVLAGLVAVGAGFGLSRLLAGLGRGGA